MECVLEAHCWLREHNKQCEGTDPPDVGAPTVTDNSEMVESENTDMEKVEEMKVLFLNSTVKTGRVAEGRKFDEAIAEIRSKCATATPFLTSRSSQRLVRDCENDTLMKAFPLQFPCGNGCSLDCNTKAAENGHLKHLLLLSIPAMHKPAFVLVVHNMFERSRMLTGAIWQVFGGKEKCDASEVDLNAAIHRHCQGLPVGVGPGEDFLRSAKTMKGRMALVAQANQAKFMSLSQHFGCSKILFTVSFDDSLDIHMAALSGMENIESVLPDMTAKESRELMEDLEGTQCRHPGLCALNFEWLLEIILETLVGDNEQRQGVLGTLEGHGLAVEEQG